MAEAVEETSDQVRHNVSHAGGGELTFAAGDWICTTCGNNVYASKSACSRCQTPKPLGGGGGSAGGPGPGYGAPYGGRGGGGGGGGGPGYNSGAPPYGAPPAAAPAEPVAQCDDKCLENGCDNSRIYVTGLAPGVTSDDIHTLFSGIGIIARIKQKRGYKDQWPYAIKIYTNEAGKPKGDATVTYEDPAAAHSASSFFTGHLLKGQKLVVQMAGKSAARPAVPAPAFRGRPY